MKVKSIIVSGLTFALLFCVSTSFAWGGKTHKKMVSDAYHIMPKAFREFLGEKTKPELKRPALKKLFEASVEPDKVLKDFHNHIFHIQAFSMGKAPFHIEELVNETAEMIKNKKPRSEIIQKLGWIAHYTCDLAQPLHTGSSLDENIEEKSYHAATERDADKYVMTYGVKFDGCTDIKRVSARMVYEALWANQYYDALEQAYTSGKRYTDSKEVISLCYSRAVNNVVDLWYTIWVKSGGKVLPSDQKQKYFPPVKKFSELE